MDWKFIGDIKYKNKSLFIDSLFKINKLTDDVTAKKISKILKGWNKTLFLLV